MIVIMTESNEDQALKSKKRSLTEILDDRLDYPRRRAAIACEICRARKSKCDGGQPKCRLCTELNADCVYRERTLKLDARDKLILEKLEHIEGLLRNTLREQQENEKLPDIPEFKLNPTNIQHIIVSSAENTAANNTQSSPSWNQSNDTSSLSHASPVSSKLSTDKLSDYVFSIPENHSTPWLHLLNLPKIARFLSSPAPSALTPLDFESSRLPLQVNPNVLLDLSNVQPLVTSFFREVNPFFAIISPFSWQSYYSIALSNGFRSGPESIIVLIVLALGESSRRESISLVPKDERIPGYDFFSCAWPLISSAILSNTIENAQALMLATAYLIYLVRPVEAWTLLSITCAKLRVIVSLKPLAKMTHDNREHFERVFWNALIFESDILAEVDLPHSGIEMLEDQVGLPSGFFISANVNNTTLPGTDDLWYFLAEISLRRLLNRVHHMLYGKTTARMPISSYHPIVEELDFQLTQWYKNLPQVLRFTFERRPLNNRFLTVLRLRYFACRTIIWRIYVEISLNDESLLRDPRVKQGASKCIDACLRQTENIEEHREGHIPYLWQGSLSIVGLVVMLMAVVTSRGLSELMCYPVEKVIDIVDKGVRFIVLNSTVAPSIHAAAEVLLDMQKNWALYIRSNGYDVKIIVDDDTVIDIFKKTRYEPS
ncbi:hypothetical protein V1511DRAFT_123880 [Dipodascopsis uninucleata]